MVVKKKMANRSAVECETIINFNESEKEAFVYTFNKSLQRKLERFAVEMPDECKKADSFQPEGSVEYVVPKSWIKVKPPVKMNLTDEQRAARAEKMRELLSNNNTV